MISDASKAALTDQVVAVYSAAVAAIDAIDKSGHLDLMHSPQVTLARKVVEQFEGFAYSEAKGERGFEPQLMDTAAAS